MAVRSIFKLNDNSEVLHKVCKPVDKIEERTLVLLDDLKDTLHYIGGLGLAAPQVGILRRVCIVEYDGELYEMINPVVTYTSKEMLVDDEGCLSVVGFRGIVKRPASIKVSFTDRNGKSIEVSAQGYKARCFLHEIDHLNGILFVDKMIKKVSK